LVSVFPSATLAVWTSAWLHGVAASDDVLDALAAWAEMHEVVADDHGTATALDIPTRDERAGQPALLLGALRRTGAVGGALVMPVPGDVRGLGGSGPFATEALRVGQGVVLPEPGLGIVPETVAESVIRWTVFDLPMSPRTDQTPLSTAEHGLTDALRRAAGSLAELDLAKHRPGVREDIKSRVADGNRARWPDGMPPRALRVLQRANEVAAILEVAAEDEPGGALSASAANQRAAALRPLLDAVRVARCAAVDEAVRVFSDHAGRH
jgi:hypothetical protein